MLKLLPLTAIALSLSSIAHACPTLDGKYRKDHGDGSTTTEIELYTKILHSREFGAKPRFQYSLGDPTRFLPADGVAHKMSEDGETGTVKISCAENWMEFEAKVENGRQATIRYTLLNEKQLRVDATGDTDDMPTGVFTKL